MVARHGTHAYTFDVMPEPWPAVTSATPPSGLPTGGTPVTISGMNFFGSTAVTSGGTASASFTEVDDWHITATAPAHAAGIVHVAVTNSYGTGTAQDAFNLRVTWADDHIRDPSAGPTAGGTTATITGTSFAGATAVKFGVNDATITSVTDTQVTVVTPAGAAGVVDVAVTATAGTGIGESRFGYEAPISDTKLTVTGSS